jgi:hypothetical protein
MKHRITKRSLEVKSAYQQKTPQKINSKQSEKVEELPANFDPLSYLELNPDVALHPLYGTVEGAKIHWLRHGKRENRKYRIEGRSPKKISQRKKKVVYTCIYGIYDTLLDPEAINPDWDYICFTNQKITTPTHWKIEEIPAECLEEDHSKIPRKIKVLAHKYLPKYDTSIWVDGNIQFLRDPEEILENYQGSHFSLMSHPERICAYEEIEACARLGKDTEDNLREIGNRLREENYPQDNGLVQTGILIRDHREEDVIRFSEMWWSMIKNYTHRDQVTFNYVLWKNPTNISLFSARVLFDEFNFYYHSRGYLRKKTCPKDYGHLTNYINGMKWKVNF